MEAYRFGITQEIIDKNKALCEKYPFLVSDNNINYEYTKLDEMPDGWRRAFGEQMCEEIARELEANNMSDTYHVLQIKEKYGSLRWYDNGFTEHGNEIISKYEELSKRTCISCGEPATLVSTGWISPWCDKCAAEIQAYVVPIEEFL